MAQNRREKVSLWRIFLTFAKIGAFTIGGGYAMVLLIRDEVVGRGWISKEEFPDLLALAQSAPGLLAVNMSIFAGYRIRGTKGSVVATLGSIMPPFLIILIVAMVFVQFKDNPVIIRIFKGIRPVVVALIAVPMVKMAMESNRKWWSWLITAASLCLVAFLNISPIYILLTTIIISLSVAVGWDRTTRMRNMRAHIAGRNKAAGEVYSEEESKKGVKENSEEEIRVNGEGGNGVKILETDELNNRREIEDNGRGKIRDNEGRAGGEIKGENGEGVDDKKEKEGGE